MKAIIFEDGKLRFREDSPAPRPGSFDALVKVRCAGVCATDLEIVKGYMGFSGIPGHEFSGVIEECGYGGLEGRRVVGEINLACGECRWCTSNLPNHCPQRSVLGIYKKDGAFAEYLTLPFRNLYLLPDSISDEEAVFIEPLAAAFEILEQVEIAKGRNVCVLGDGRLGLLVSQVLSLTGCNLLSIGRHTNKLSVLDKRGIRTSTSIDGLGREFDIVVDCTGSRTGLPDALRIIRPRGTIVLKTTLAGESRADLNRVVIDEIRLIGSRCGPFRPAIKALEDKKVDVRPLIGKVFTLEEGQAAFDYAASKGAMKALLRI